MTKADAVRAAMAEGVEKPQDACEWIKTKFGIDITPAHFSSYKSGFKKKEGAGSSGGRRGRPPQAASASGGINDGNTRTSNPADLARAVKALVAAHGADAVAEMAQVFKE